MTITEFLRKADAANELLKAANFPFNDRELAKAEYIKSLLKKIDSGKINELTKIKK